MKILVAYAKFNPKGRAGSDVYLLGLCRELVNLGHEITVVTTASAGFTAPEAFSLKWANDFDPALDADAGFKVLRFPVTGQIPDFLRAPAARYLLNQWKVENLRDGMLAPYSSRFPEFTHRQVKSRSSLVDRLHAYTIGPHSPSLKNYLDEHTQDYDCVIAGYFPFSIVHLATLAARKANRPCFIAPLYHSEDRHHYFQHLFEAFEECDGVICETANAKELFERLIPNISCVQAGIGVNQGYLTMPGGQVPSWITEIREKKQRILLYVGRKEESKNYRVLVEAMRQLDDPSIVLVMIGKDIDDKPIDHPNIILLDKIDDEELHWAYYSCDIFVFPSLKESFGIVILEAWAAQKPVIGHQQCAAVASLIEDNVSGMLCDSVESWMAAIKLLLDDPGKARSLGIKGRSTLISNYTWKTVGAKVDAFIKSKIEKPRQSAHA